MAAGNALASLSPLANEPPSSSYAKIGTIVALSGARQILKFAVSDSAYWTFTVPDCYDGVGNVVVAVEGAMDATNTSTKVVDIRCQFERHTGTPTVDGTGGGLDFGGTEQATSITVNNTANGLFSGTVTLTNAQAAGIQPLDFVRLRIRRVVTNDTATGNFQLLMASVKQA